MIEIFFWSCAAITLYVFAGYPLVLCILARVAAKPVQRGPVTPSVSLLVAAYNEAEVIVEKIQNSLALDYPPDRYEIVIASDGSLDATVELAKQFEDGKRVRVLSYPVNRGKLPVLNDSVPQLRGEIVAFSDATSMLAPDALRLLVRSFADPGVGGVSGIYRVRKLDEAEVGTSEGLYWQYETFLKVQEAAVGSILGGHGSLYAIRRHLYPFPPPNTINDDFVIPLRVVQQGYRMAYDPEAVASEEAHEMDGFSRRVRIMTGNVKQLNEIKALLRPRLWVESFVFLSHKAGRLLVPPCLMGMLAANALLLGNPLYRGIGALQAVFYGVAVAGWLWRLHPKALRMPYYFTMINVAAVLGMYFGVTGRGRVVWKRDAPRGHQVNLSKRSETESTAK